MRTIIGAITRYFNRRPLLLAFIAVGAADAARIPTLALILSA